MKRIIGLFLLGLATLLPGVLLLYAIGWLVLGGERLLGRWLAVWLPEGAYLPGMGLLAVVLLVLLTGLLARSWIGPPAGRWISARIGEIPVLGRLYLSLRAAARRLSGDRPTAFAEVVFVPIPEGGGRLGLVAERQPLRCTAKGPALIPVYFPAAFQPGGVLELLPEERLEPSHMTVDQAMSLILSGGLVTGSDDRPDDGEGASPQGGRPSAR
ncbi:MAG: DUF502 domain-containing protein [Ectothiorhodospiraceae bacterium]|nr:DUF502 domain-containing protein [Ectothiorhodospiraceae bacterium]